MKKVFLSVFGLSMTIAFAHVANAWSRKSQTIDCDVTHPTDPVVF